MRHAGPSSGWHLTIRSSRPHCAAPLSPRYRMTATATHRKATCSPRKRFWVASLSAPLPALAAAFLAPIAAIPLLVACWLLALHWVLVAHSPSGRIADIPIARLVLVAVGLTTGIAISAAIAAAISAPLFLHGRYQHRAGPQQLVTAEIDSRWVSVTTSHSISAKVAVPWNGFAWGYLTASAAQGSHHLPDALKDSAWKIQGLVLR